MPMVFFGKRPAAPAPALREAPADSSPHFGEQQFPEAVQGFGNIDREGSDPFHPEFAEKDLLGRVEEQVATGDFALPHLPLTHLKLLELTANADADVARVERTIAPDLALTASLLKIANSSLYGGTRQSDTVRGAILRIGIRGLRSALLSLALRSVIFRGRELAPIAEEVWRQSLSVANNARADAVPLALDPERAFVLGLLHDIGKVPLLQILRELAPKGFDFRRPFVGHVFRLHHETVGRRLATEWNLPEEVVEVAGCHHDYARNERHGRAAALVHLAHKQDLHLSAGDADGYFALAEDATMQTLELPPLMRKSLLDAVRIAYLRTGDVAASLG